MGIKPSLSLTLLLLLTTIFISSSSAATLTEQCSDSFTKLTMCLSFASGKAPTPDKGCCESVEKIKESNPVCLCYIIVQTHNGTESTKSVGLREDRLLQLPSACRLVDASLTACPKLLKIPPTSPDYAIFTNTTTPSAPSTGTSSSPAKKDNSNAFKTAPCFVWPIVISVAILFLFGAPSH